jgi:hypothetical protein
MSVAGFESGHEQRIVASTKQENCIIWQKQEMVFDPATHTTCFSQH